MESTQKKEGYYTYADYCTWDDGKRWELIDGVAYAMAHAPSRTHQSISVAIASQLYNFLNGKRCKVFTAPFDVRLNVDSKDDIVVQPDILVVCNESKLNDSECVGAPDFIVEVLSPSTAQHDRLRKFRLYQNSGVREYWIVDPDSKTVAAHIIYYGVYRISMYGSDDLAPVHVLEGCTINLSDVFED